MQLINGAQLAEDGLAGIVWEVWEQHHDWNGWGGSDEWCVNMCVYCDTLDPVEADPLDCACPHPPSGDQPGHSALLVVPVVLVVADWEHSCLEKCDGNNPSTIGHR